MCADYGVRSSAGPLTYCTPATLASFWFLKYAKVFAISGPAWLLFPLLGMLSPEVFTWLVFPPFRSQINVATSEEPSQTTWSEVGPLASSPQNALLFSLGTLITPSTRSCAVWFVNLLCPPLECTLQDDKHPTGLIHPDPSIKHSARHTAGT